MEASSLAALEILLSYGSPPGLNMPPPPAAPPTSFPVQRLEGAGPEAAPAFIRGAASFGLNSPAGRLTFLSKIQRSFEHHDVSNARAHTDGTAALGRS